MVRTSKNVVSSASPVVVDSSVVEVPPVVVAVDEKAGSKKSKKSSSKKEVVPPPVVVEEPVSVTPVVVEDVNVAVAPVSAENMVALKMAEFNTQLQQLSALSQTIKTQYRSLEKTFNKELKAYYKATSKKHKRSGNRQPSGFVRPTLISEELASFLGKEMGTEMARTEVSKEINQYIRSNNLQDKANGRNINPDAKLIALLKLKEGDMLSYFNLQKYMKHHFVKTTPAVVV